MIFLIHGQSWVQIRGAYKSEWRAYTFIKVNSVSTP
jgi:hypothetical protein